MYIYIKTNVVENQQFNCKYNHLNLQNKRFLKSYELSNNDSNYLEVSSKFLLRKWSFASRFECASLNHKTGQFFVFLIFIFICFIYFLILYILKIEEFSSTDRSFIYFILSVFLLQNKFFLFQHFTVTLYTSESGGPLSSWLSSLPLTWESCYLWHL